MAGLYEVDPITALIAQMSFLTNQIVALTTQGSQLKVEIGAATSISHHGNEMENEQVQYVNNCNLNYRGNNLPNYYHLGLRNNQNFSYGNTKNVIQPPPGFNNQAVKKKPSFEDLQGTFISETRSRFNKNEPRLDNLETHISNIGATLKSLEVQIGQLATTINSQQKGNFRSNIEVNPKEHFKAITLRSGKEIQGSDSKKCVMSKEIPSQEKEEQDEERENKEVKNKQTFRPKSIAFSNNPQINRPHLPYPQRF